RRSARRAGARPCADRGRAARRRGGTPLARARGDPRRKPASRDARAARSRGSRAARRRTPRAQRRLRQRDRRAAGRTCRRTGRSLPLEHILAELHLVARARAGGLEDRLELLLGWRLARDAKATLGAEDPKPAPLRPGPV